MTDRYWTVPDYTQPQKVRSNAASASDNQVGQPKMSTQDVPTIVLGEERGGQTTAEETRQAGQEGEAGQANQTGQASPTGQANQDGQTGQANQGGQAGQASQAGQCDAAALLPSQTPAVPDIQVTRASFDAGSSDVN